MQYIFAYVQNYSAASNDGPVNPDFSPPVQQTQQPQPFVWPPPQWVAWIQQQQQQPGWSQTPTWLPPPMWPQHPPPPPLPSAPWVVWTCFVWICIDLYGLDLDELVWTWLVLVVVDERNKSLFVSVYQMLAMLILIHEMLIVIYMKCLGVPYT